MTDVRGRREDGLVGGIEVLPFGLLVFVVGTLVATQAWTVVDAKLAADAAAREAGLAYVEASPPGAVRAAERAARAAFIGAGWDPTRMELVHHGSPERRCSEVVTHVTLTVPGVRLPWVGRWGATTVQGRHRDVVDPFRSGRQDEASCGS